MSIWVTLRQLFNQADQLQEAWVFLPKSGAWALDTEALVAQTEEVSPDEEDEDEAGYPPVAREKRLLAALPVTTVQDIVFNAKAQRPLLSEEETLEAFMFYYRNDAFLEFK